MSRPPPAPPSPGPSRRGAPYSDDSLAPVTMVFALLFIFALTMITGARQHALEARIERLEMQDHLAPGAPRFGP